MSADQIADEIENTLEQRGQTGALQYFRAMRRIVGPREALRMLGVDR